MKLVTFAYGGGLPKVGIVDGSSVREVYGFDGMTGAIAAGLPAIVAAAKGPAQDLKSVRLLAPIPRPPKVVCVGLNYRDHAIESNMPIPTIPVIFSKFPNTVIANGDDVVIPRNSEKPDYEVELAFVMGKSGRHIPKEKAMDYVFGYTVVNDVSARDFQLATSQWLMGKTFDTFCPMGPWIVTADEVKDPHNLKLGLKIDGEPVQDSSTKELIFRIPELIAHLSSVFSFEAGDVVSTGTPPGVGMGRKPPRWLKPGENMTAWVEGVGELSNRCVADA